MVFLEVAGIVFCYMLIWYVVSLLLKNSSIVDIAWGIGFIVVSLFTLLMYSSFTFVQILVTSLVLIWGIRLSSHIAIRNFGRGEDWRYANWRREWGKWHWLRSFFQVFMLQGLIMYIIALPIVAVNSLVVFVDSWLVWLGLAIWLIGFFFEAIGDYQLSQFVKTKKKGEIMTTGLWKYTRHPNYFGEVTMWWGIFVISFAVGASMWFIVSPLLLTYLILKVSGVPMLEKRYEGQKNWEAYKEKTSMFIPRFPKD